MQLKQRIYRDLEETERQLDREMQYSEDLRKHDQIKFYTTHIDFLKNVITQIQTDTTIEKLLKIIKGIKNANN